MDIETLKAIAAFVVPAAALLAASVVIVKQGHVGVVTRFGKYRRLLRPGLNFRIPVLERVFRSVSLQLRSAELEFQAISGDQANVNFKALIIYMVANGSEETIMKAAFKFVDDRSFMQSLIRSIEGSIRSFVALKKQSEILRLRREIIDEVNAYIEHELQDWGFHLVALQINDISFDEAILRSMAQVVASNNMLLAAQNEAQAQYVTKTRVAEAEAQARRLSAQAERDADALRGEGNALLRRNMAAGLADAGKTLEEGGIEPAFMLYTMWLDAMKAIAAGGSGNLLSFDGSMEGFDRTMRQMQMLGRQPECVHAA
jgi:regulator of protease activity HflC (stomatin/prohibitin superfamily)